MALYLLFMRYYYLKIFFFQKNKPYFFLKPLIYSVLKVPKVSHEIVEIFFGNFHFFKFYNCFSFFPFQKIELFWIHNQTNLRNKSNLIYIKYIPSFEWPFTLYISAFHQLRKVFKTFEKIYWIFVIFRKNWELCERLFWEEFYDQWLF